MSETLGERLADRRNSLNAVRLLLAVAVIYGHATPLGGFVEGTGVLEIAGLAVDGFFAISGYLIAASRMRLSMPRFLWHRGLRLMPGFWVCLLVTALVFSPIVGLATDTSWSLRSALGYVTGNAALDIEVRGIGGTLADAPYPVAWNGSLWTLWYEAVAYLGAGLLLTLAVIRRRPTPVLVALVLLAAAAVPLAHGPLEVSTSRYLLLIRLGSFFLAGMLLWALRERLPWRPWAVAAAGAVAIWLFASGELWLTTLGPLPVAYAVLGLGGVHGVPLGRRGDLSYGVYVYAFPVAQMLAVAGAAGLGHLPFALMTLAATWPLAWLSWRLVEKPALAAKRWTPSLRLRPTARDLSEV